MKFDVNNNQRDIFKMFFNFKVIIFFSVFLLARETWAVTCTVNTSSVTVNAGTFTVQRDAIIGTPISNLITGANNLLISCNTNHQTIGGISLRSVTTLSQTFPSYNGNGVFSTGLNGVGTIMGTYGTTQGFGTINLNKYVPPNNSGATIGGLGSPTSSMPFTVFGKNIFQLIKTNNTISSGVINMKVAEMYATGTASFTSIPVYLIGTVNVLACSVSTPNVNVTLPTVNVNSFTGVGNTLGDTPFSVLLQCDAGAKINATMNFTQDSDTTNQSVAAVTGKGGAGIASGVGIQLLYGGVPLNNNTQTLLKTTNGGLELPAGAFSVRYFQTRSTVQAGNANTTAMMTLTYQ